MNMKSVILIFFAIIGFTMLSSAIFMSQNYKMIQDNAFKSAVPVEITQIKEASTDANKIRAMLKGSIYESGEGMTVFGACFDGYGYLLPGSNATFSSWYPNGTQWHNESPMVSIDSSGRFDIQLTMGDAYGTYLTEIKCMYEGDYAVAYGEWQNPDWVKRIKDTQDSVINLTSLASAQYANLTILIGDFKDEIQVNFSQVLDAIANIDITPQFTGLDTQLKEIYNQVHALDTSFWVIDAQAPWYSFGSGMFEFRAVDMLSLNDIYAVSDDGYIVYWDGETWSVKANYSGIAWYGVSVLPASTPYAWSVGSDITTSTSVYSVNGGTPTTFNDSIGTAYWDVKLFPAPNSPSSNFMGYILEDNGAVWYSSDSAITFDNPINLTCSATLADIGRISQILSNADLGVTSGYRLAIVMCDQFLYYDGVGFSAYTVANQKFRDVEVVYNDVAFAVSKDTVTNELNVYQFNGTALSLVYSANDSTIEPRGIAAATPNDVWVVTNNPSVYYHYDGFKWEYANYPYSGAIGLSILFTNGTIPGLYDISMFNSKNAYAVGTDGLIMKFYSAYDERFDKVITDILNLSNTLNLSILNDIYGAVINGTTYNISVVLASMNTSLMDLTNIVLAMNFSIMTELTSLDAKIDLLNASMNVRFDEVITEISYLDLYLNSTIYPALNLILERLGVIETNVNATLQIVNETQITVNQMNASINELLNQSRRIHAWITV